MSKRRTNTEQHRPLKRMKDEGRSDNDDDDGDIMDQSQRPDFRTASMGEEADMGIIERIQLKNFMCHTRLDFPFCPNINFITGNNGSGKSAILTGLVVGLGGGAKATSRGTSVRGFIKNGKQSGEVIIKLRNRGSEAFKHDQYGDSIIIKRTVKAVGGSAYRLENAEGKLVSNKKEELDHIVDHFNIQINNPVAVLNQDTSRNFLHSKNPNDKYKFFLKATQLEQMKQDYCSITEQMEITKGIISTKETTVPTLHAEVLEWEKKFKAVQNCDDLRGKIQALKNEIAWAIVIECEESLKPLTKAHRVEDARTPKFQQKVDECQAKLDECMVGHKEIQDKLKTYSTEAQKLVPQHADAKKVLSEKKKVVRAVQLEERKIQSELRTVTKDRDQTLERINEIRNSAQEDHESERIAREQKIRGLEEELNGCQGRRKTTEHEVEQFRAAVTKYKEEGYRLSNNEKEVRHTLEEKKNQLRNLQDARSDRLKRFGAWVPTLLEKIEVAHRQNRFHQKPRGPLGACIQLKDPSCALGVECCLKNLMHSYCCTDYHDEKILNQIMTQVCPKGRPKPTIIVSRFLEHVHDVSQFRSRCEFPTVLDMLELDDPVVANALVDQRGIENVILIKNAVQARQFMGKNKDRNTKEAFVGNGDQVFSFPTFRYYASSTDKASFLKADVEEEIRSLEVEIAGIQQEAENLRKKRASVDSDIQSNQMEERRTQTKLMKISERIEKLMSEIDELKSIEDPEPVDVTTLEEEVGGFNQQIEELQGKVNEVRDKLKETQAEVQKAEEEFKQIDEKMRSIADGAEPLKEELAHAETQIEVAKSNKKHYDGKMKEHEKKLSDIKKLVEAKKKEIEEKCAKAEAVCPRKNTRRTQRNLESEIIQIEKQLKAQEKSHGNKEEITRKYYETKDAYLKIKKEIKQFGNFLKLLQDVMGTRQHQFIEFRKMIALRAKYYFIVMLSNRSYVGKMTFNHKQEILELSVQPSNQSAEGAKDMRALSGGERSFSTVCFILALWDAMESPFRCMDEFDVYMDMVNRRISMDMLMEVAKNQKTRQFIFLTPQNMSNLQPSPTLKIFKMPDPQRGSGVIETTREQEEEQEAMAT